MRFLLLLILCLGSVPAAGQPSDNASKFWVFFSDKPAVAAKAVPVSPRAEARRAMRASRPASHLDIAVDASYVAALSEFGVAPMVESRWLNAVSAQLTDVQYQAVKALPFVARVSPVGRMLAPQSAIEPDFPVFGETSTNPLRRLIYGDSEGQLAQIGAIGPLEAGINGTGVRLGIIDTWPGDLDHPSLTHLSTSGRLLAFRDFTGRPAETYSHGMMVLSIAAGYDEGNLIGPGYGAEVLFAASEYAPTETNQEEDHWVEAIEWLESEGVDVINTSLGYSVFDPDQNSYTYADMDGNTAVTTIAGDIAVGLGVVLVASAGNEGCSDPSFCWYYVTAPADGDSVITAGAATASGLKASFSSFGPTFDGRIKPDLSARGQGVTVATGTTDYSSFGNGTSFSAPLISGVVAQLLQTNPSLTPIEVLETLRATASQAQNPDNELGWGIINAEAAIDLASPTDPNPDPTSLDVQVWPNPMLDNGTIRITLPPDSGPARAEFFDLTGRRLSVYEGGSGRNWFLRLDTQSWPSGPVIYRVSTGGAVSSGLLFHVR